MSGRGFILFLIGMQWFVSAYAAELTIFDRFFTNSAARKQLDQSREQFTSITHSQGEVLNSMDTGFYPEVEIKGLVVRGDGSSEVWLNNTSTVGKNRSSQDLKSNTRRIGEQSVRVTLSDGEFIILKPGQVYTPDNQRILEGYQTAIPFKPEPELKEETEEKESNTKEATLEQEKEFDESVLAETDTKIKLLEERIQKLEGQR